MIAKAKEHIKAGSVVIVRDGYCFAITTAEEFNQPYEAIFNVATGYSKGQDVEYFTTTPDAAVDLEFQNIKKLIKIQPKVTSENKKKLLSLISMKTKSLNKEAMC